MTQLAPDAGLPPAKAAPASDRLGIFSWCLFDWANSAFNTVIGTFIFSVYFIRSVHGDPVDGTEEWADMIIWSGVAVAVLSPIFGAIADRSGRRKPWIAVFVLLTIVPTALLWYTEPDPRFVLYALVLVGLANVAFELSIVFYNAMLPDIAPKPALGRISGWAWGLGYAGGLTCLAVALVGFVGLGDMLPALFDLPTERSENIRVTAPLVALWFGLFCLPMLLFTRDEPATGIGVGTAIRQGIATLVETLRKVRRYGQIVRFLIASAIYRDGLVVLFSLGGAFAAGAFGMDFTQILIFAIGLNVTAGIGAAAFAWLDDGIGSKPTILISLAGLIAVGIPTLLVTDATTFIVMALFLGIFVGPTQAASRSLMARLSPPDMETEMFGLYAMTGKSAAIVGPSLYKLFSETFDSQRAGMSSILLFWLIGGALLLTVREPARPPRSG